MTACRCEVLNSLRGAAATEYARTHLDTLREDAIGRQRLRCPDTEVTWVLEPVGGVFGNDEQHVLRRG